jgi:hypothetical protein
MYTVGIKVPDFDLCMIEQRTCLLILSAQSHKIALRASGIDSGTFKHSVRRIGQGTYPIALVAFVISLFREIRQPSLSPAAPKS